MSGYASTARRKLPLRVRPAPRPVGYQPKVVAVDLGLPDGGSDREVLGYVENVSFLQPVSRTAFVRTLM